MPRRWGRQDAARDERALLHRVPERVKKSCFPLGMELCMKRIGHAHLVRQADKFTDEYTDNYMQDTIQELIVHVAAIKKHGSIELDNTTLYQWQNMRKWLDVARQFGFDVTWVYEYSFQLDLSLWDLVCETKPNQYLTVAAKTAYAAKYWRWLRRRGILTANPDVDLVMQRTLRPTITDDLRLWEQYNLLKQLCLPRAILTYIGNRDEEGNEVPPLKFSQEYSTTSMRLSYMGALMEQQQEMFDLFSKHATREEHALCSDMSVHLYDALHVYNSGGDPQEALDRALTSATQLMRDSVNELSEDNADDEFD